jgi:hypothetical protein
MVITKQGFQSTEEIAQAKVLSSFQKWNRKKLSVRIASESMAQIVAEFEFAQSVPVLKRMD